jgi:hypothetical protein
MCFLWFVVADGTAIALELQGEAKRFIIDAV